MCVCTLYMCLCLHFSIHFHREREARIPDSTFNAYKLKYVTNSASAIATALLHLQCLRSFPNQNQQAAGKEEALFRQNWIIFLCIRACRILVCNCVQQTRVLATLSLSLNPYSGLYSCSRLVANQRFLKMQTNVLPHFLQLKKTSNIFFLHLSSTLFIF